MMAREIPAQVWWRSGYLWLIMGLTAAAIAASAVTLYLALQVPLEPAAGGSSAAAQEQGGALDPALQARNRTGSRNAREMGRQRQPEPESVQTPRP